ncbi:hypothetical protein GCM10022414_07880 [Zhongshania borealis]|uniref:Uncharacterized protein n=1 Tax=Zhongshania borealis TaxID=889488 RepID=A0ABP7WFV7_9GAMM
MAAITDMDNSGSEVPTATNVKPMTASGTLKYSAIPMAPINKICDPPINNIKPRPTAIVIHNTDFESMDISSASAWCSSPDGAAWKRSLR